MRRLFPLLLPALLLLIGQIASPAAAPAPLSPSSKDADVAQGFVAPTVIKGDPMDWSPPKDPSALRQALGPKIYARRFKAERAKIDLDALRDPSRPTSGELVTSIYPHSQAIALGIKVKSLAEDPVSLLPTLTRRPARKFGLFITATGITGRIDPPEFEAISDPAGAPHP